MHRFFIPWLLLIAGTRVAVAAESASDEPFPTPTTKKGLQVQMVDDALALGIGHAALNVDLTRLIDPAGDGGGPVWERGGESFAFSPRVVANLDAQIKPLSDAGVVVYLILLPYASRDRTRNALMLHPSYARGEPQAGPIGMFNTTRPEATAWLAATVEFLAARYGGTGDQGRVWGYIAGNEVNSHWYWANMGLATEAEVVAEYAQGVRTIHAAVRTASAHARVYISLDHCWASRYAAGSARQCIAGRSFLDRFAAAIREQGDIDWHVAYHPYPEPLTECRFWLDEKHSPQTETAPVVSFRNLEVLARHLDQPHLQWNGSSRRVILSEQGFHCSDRPQAEQEQAAAFALAYKKVARLKEIDAFLLHRHVDHAGEGGLRLGLWTNKPGTVSTPDRKRAMYEVFRAAGAADESQVFDPLLATIGAASWEEALQRLHDN
jgi:hypothetical protein